jgi:hypothetical protein
VPARLENDRFRLELAVAGYEFPDLLRDPYDANWLVIRATLQSVHSAWRWQVEDAGALTWELAGCIQWLRALAASEPVEEGGWGFSEPDISFEVVRQEGGAVIGLAVNLMDEFQPPTKVLIPRQSNIATLRFHTPPEVLSAFADGLAMDLNRFPQRGDGPS